MYTNEVIPGHLTFQATAIVIRVLLRAASILMQQNATRMMHRIVSRFGILPMIGRHSPVIGLRYGQKSTCHVHISNNA